jgi:hypothetical protein
MKSLKENGNDMDLEDAHNIERQIKEEKNQVRAILEEGEAYGELDPRGEYDVMARILLR